MTKHQKLQKKINGIIQPDAEKLLIDGCDICDKIELNPTYTIGEDGLCLKNRKSYYIHGVECPFENFEILGQKLNLEAVLMGFHKSKIQFQVSYLLSETVSVIINFHEQIIFKWHLTLPPDQQPIETQKALFEIFNV